jgi:glycosyltransferase involved in cell wall biosynthesis
MARVVVFGLGPMRWEQSTRLFALPLRTWHFAATLARDRHEVLLFSMRTAAFEGWPTEKVTRVERDGVTIYSLSEHLLHERPDWVQAKIEAFAPDCIVGVNKDPAAIAVNYAGDLPFWADINGDPMAEAQAKAEAVHSDMWTAQFYERFVTVLQRADAYSTCSTPQRNALIGQLSMIGRLTGVNAGYDFVHAIPNSIDDDELRLLSAIERRPRKRNDPFILLWSGGYNTWCDPQLLYEAVDRAMTEEPRLRFVSTGGAIGGHYTEGFEQFQARVARSGHRDRYHFAGWVQTAELPAYYADAHAAILTDRFGYEGILGARTRMLDWLAAGLPVVTTRLSEISEVLEEEGAALCSECGDVPSMLANILRLVNDPDLAVEMGRRGRLLSSEVLRAGQQLAPLREWVASPSRAPDGERRLHLPASPASSGQLGSLARQWVHRTRESGLRESIADVRRFAVRRARHGVQRALDRAGLPGGVEVIELSSPQAESAEAPRLGALQWRKKLAELSDAPEVAVVVIVRADDAPDVMEWTLEQIARQYYDHWHLLVAVQGSTHAIRERLHAALERMRERGFEATELDATFAQPFAHRAAHASDYVVLLGVGDLLRPDAIAELVTAARDNDADVVYADEQDVDETNAPRPVDRKPDFSPDLLLAKPFLGRCVLYRAGAAELDADHAASWPADALAYELALRATEVAETIVHLDRVLSQRYRSLRAGGASALARERQVAERSLDALRDALWRRSAEAHAERGARAGTFRVRYTLPSPADVTLVVPAAGPAERLERCLRALEAHTSHAEVDLVIAVGRDAPPLPRGEWVLSRAPHATSHAGTIHAAFKKHVSSFVAWVLPEVEVVKDGWLDELVRQAGRQDVGAAAPKLLEPSGRRAWPRSKVEDLVTEVSGLPFQCVVMRRDRYLAAGGLDPELDLKGAVDQLGERLASTGQTLVYTPYSALYIHPDPAPESGVSSRRKSA